MTKNPFPGPQPYRAEDRDRFYARDGLIKKLANQVLACPATTVFGPSGAGKSSLMQAGVIPRLEDLKDMRVVRVDAWPANEASLPWLVGTMFSDFDLGAVPEGKTATEALELAIDLAAERSDRPMLIYLDQIEQLFVAEHAADEMNVLLQGLAWLIDAERSQDVHVVLSLREDYLGRLRDWTRERPELSAHGFRVAPLSVGEMVKAMCRTAKEGEPPQEWDEKEIGSLMLDVRVPGQSATDAAEVQTAFGQIVCRALWEERAAGQSGDVKGTNAEAILQRYLDTTLGGLGSLQALAQQLLEEHLIDDEGHRRLLTEKEARLVLRSSDAVAVLDKLDAARVLRAEEHQGSRYFELGHDWLAKKVLERRVQRKERAARRRRAAIAVIVAAIIAVLGGMLWWALEQKKDADAQRQEADAQRDAARAAQQEATQNAKNAQMATVRELIASGKPGLAALVLTEVDAPEKARGWQQLAIDMLAQGIPWRTIPFDKDVDVIQWSPDRKLIATAHKDHAVRVWNADGTGEPVVLKGHQGEVNEIAWSPDGTRIVIVPTGETTRVWWADGHGDGVVLKGHGHVAYSCGMSVWSPDGTRIGSDSAGAVHIWNVDGSGEPIVFKRPEGKTAYGMSQIAWNPSGTRIVAGFRDAISHSSDWYVWNADGTGNPILLDRGRSRVFPQPLSWSPDGKRIVISSDGAPPRIWNTNGEGKPLVLGGDKFYTAKFTKWSPDGQRIATASYDNEVRLWNADGSGEPTVFRGHTEALNWVEWSPDGNRIVTASNDKTVRVWNVNGLGATKIFKGGDDRAFTARWTPDGKRIVTVFGDRTAHIWNAEVAGVMHAHGFRIDRAWWSPNGERIATLMKAVDGANDVVRVWNADGSDVPLLLKGYGANITSVAWSPDGQRIVTVSSDKTARVWNADGSGEPFVFRGHDTNVTFAAWHSDGERIVTVSVDGTVRVWNADGSGVPVAWNGGDGKVESAALSPDGKRILIATNDTVRVCNLDGSDKLLVRKGDKGIFKVVAWSPGGERIFIGSALDGRIWNANGWGEAVLLEGGQVSADSVFWSPDGKRIVMAMSFEHFAIVRNTDGSGDPLILKGHDSGLRAASWSPDGQRIVTASRDNTARIWNADGSGEAIVLKGHAREVRSASFSRDGKRVLTASDDGTARIWLIDIPLLREALRNATTDCLTPAQRETYLLESQSDARARYEQCESKYGRTPRDVK